MIKVNAVYFSCGRDEEMMMDSIESLRRVYCVNKIFVASDMRDPIKNKVDDIIYIDKLNSSEKLYGLDNIKEMLKIFKVAAEDCDYVQKIDSDVIVCSDYAYKELEENEWSYFASFPMAIESMIPKNHGAGPSYFIKSEVAGRLIDIAFPESVKAWQAFDFPEDMVTSHLVNKLTDNIFIDGTAMHQNGKYLFDTYLTNIAAESKEYIETYGFAHTRTNPRVAKYILSKLKS